MTDIDDRIGALERELAALRAELASRPAAPAPTTATAHTDRSLAEEINRRSLLRKTGVAVAGAAAGGLVLAGTQASPVAAASGDNFIIGDSNTAGTDTSSLSAAPVPTNGALGASGATLVLTNTNTTSGIIHSPLRLTINALTSGSSIVATQPTATSGHSGSLIAAFTTAPTGSTGADANGFIDLFFCHRGMDKDAAITRTWGKVHTSGNANYVQYLTTPQRLVNTRTSAKPTDNSTNEFTLSAAPSDAVGFIGTITVTDNTSDGNYVSVYNGDLATIASPQFSQVNAGQGQTLATGLTVAFGAAKKIKVYCFKSTHVLIDVAAWVVTGG